MAAVATLEDAMKWRVCVVRDGDMVELGQVTESSEPSARRIAVQRFGIADYQVEVEGVRPRGAAIYPDEHFEVLPAH